MLSERSGSLPTASQRSVADPRVALWVAAGKSGANQSPAAVTTISNDKLNTNTWTNNQHRVARGRQRHNEYGFTLSGPTVIPKLYDGRNRTFFFNWEHVNDHG